MRTLQARALGLGLEVGLQTWDEDFTSFRLGLRSRGRWYKLEMGTLQAIALGLGLEVGLQT